MFGYIAVNQGEMKYKDFAVYRSYYCGLCKSLREAGGRWGQLSLSYDMTFLVMLLTALYEPEVKKRLCRCLAHPGAKHMERRSPFSDYCAAMNLVLTYYKCMDDWADEGKLSRLFYGKLLSGKIKKSYAIYGSKIHKISYELHCLRKKEKNKEQNPDLMASSFGKVMGTLFVWKKDIWANSLYRMGFYLGKFIYLLDAYEDIEEDKKKNNYNVFLLPAPSCPWKPVYGQADFDEKCEQMLRLMIAECSRAFEQLPILAYGDILRNILYSGVWARFWAVRQKRKDTQEETI